MAMSIVGLNVTQFEDGWLVMDPQLSPYHLNVTVGHLSPSPNVHYITEGFFECN